MNFLRNKIAIGLKRIAMDFDHHKHTPSNCLCIFNAPAGWQPVGVVPMPTTRWGWFMHHMMHRLMMQYSVKQALAFAFLHSAGLIDDNEKKESSI